YPQVGHDHATVFGHDHATIAAGAEPLWLKQLWLKQLWLEHHTVPVTLGANLEGYWLGDDRRDRASPFPSSPIHAALLVRYATDPLLSCIRRYLEQFAIARTASGFPLSRE